MLTAFTRWGRTWNTSRARLLGAALAAGAMGWAATPATALGDDGRLSVDLGNGRLRVTAEGRDHGHGRPVVEERRVKVWVEPVYRTVSDQVWVEPVYRSVPQRVWSKPVVKIDFEREWIPDRYEVRFITRREHGRTVKIKQRVLLEPGRYERRRKEIVVKPGCWETIMRQECVSEGRWDTVTRQELVSAGRWEWRTERVPVGPPRRRDVRVGFEANVD